MRRTRLPVLRTSDLEDRTAQPHIAEAVTSSFRPGLRDRFASASLQVRQVRVGLTNGNCQPDLTAGHDETRA